MAHISYCAKILKECDISRLNETLSSHWFISPDSSLSSTFNGTFVGLLNNDFRTIRRGLSIISHISYIPREELHINPCHMHLFASETFAHTRTFLNAVLLPRHTFYLLICTFLHKHLGELYRLSPHLI